MHNQLLVPPGPTASCRCDSATWSFKCPTQEIATDWLNLGWAVGHKVLPNGDMSRPRQGRLFSEVRSHDSGVQIELTPPDLDKRNAGTGILTVPGAVFAALAPQERLELYREVYGMPGYFRCTRFDTQFTVLEPPVNIYDFLDSCLRQDYWVRGYSQSQPYIRLDKAGNHVIAPTMYFGAPDSPSRVRIYDHGAKWGWDVETMRFEIQQRKRNANDTFRSLMKQTADEDTNAPALLVKEAMLVMSVSREKLDLRDTSQIDRQALGPKWLRQAPPVAWYSELVATAGEPVERQARPQSTLEQSIAASTEQYGGNIGAHCLRAMAVEGCTLKQAGESYAMRCISKMSDMHRARAKEGLTEAEAARVDALYVKLTRKASELAEHFWV